MSRSAVPRPRRDRWRQADERDGRRQCGCAAGDHRCWCRRERDRVARRGDRHHGRIRCRSTLRVGRADVHGVRADGRVGVAGVLLVVVPVAPSPNVHVAVASDADTFRSKIVLEPFGAAVATIATMNGKSVGGGLVGGGGCGVGGCGGGGGGGGPSGGWTATEHPASDGSGGRRDLHDARWRGQRRRRDPVGYSSSPWPRRTCPVSALKVTDTSGRSSE
jgi:hypothetical protein